MHQTKSFSSIQKWWCLTCFRNNRRRSTHSIFSIIYLIPSWSSGNMCAYSSSTNVPSTTLVKNSCACMRSAGKSSVALKLPCDEIDLSESGIIHLPGWDLIIRTTKEDCFSCRIDNHPVEIFVSRIKPYVISCPLASFSRASAASQLSQEVPFSSHHYRGKFSACLRTTKKLQSQRWIAHLCLKDAAVGEEGMGPARKPIVNHLPRVLCHAPDQGTLKWVRKNRQMKRFHVPAVISCLCLQRISKAP